MQLVLPPSHPVIHMKLKIQRRLAIPLVTICVFAIFVVAAAQAGALGLRNLAQVSGLAGQPTAESGDRTEQPGHSAEQSPKQETGLVATVRVRRAGKRSRVTVKLAGSAGEPLVGVRVTVFSIRGTRTLNSTACGQTSAKGGVQCRVRSARSGARLVAAAPYDGRLVPLGP